MHKYLLVAILVTIKAMIDITIMILVDKYVVK